MKKWCLVSILVLSLVVLPGGAAKYKTLADILQEALNVVTEITPVEAAAKVGEKDVVFLDVREPTEIENGRIPGAVVLPRGLLEFKIEKMYPDRDAQLFVVYCKAGGRGLLATKTLIEMGYKAVNIKGGITAWKKEGLPLE